MPKIRIPLVGNLTARDPADTSTTLGVDVATDQRYGNVSFTRYDGLGGAKYLMSAREHQTFYPAPGAASTNGTAVKVWTGNSNVVVSAFGATNSTIYNETTSLGAITGLAGYITETVLSGTATLFITSESNRGYSYQVGPGLVEITDVDFPPKQGTPLTITGPFVHFDGFNGIMCTNGQFWHSDVNSAANWTSTSSISANDQPDAGVAAIRHRNYVILFGKNSYEPHINTGNASGSVLSRVTGAARNVGLVNQYAVCNFMGSIAWVGSQNGLAVYLMDGLEAKRISSPTVEFSLIDNQATCRLNAITSFGVPQLLLTFGSSSATGYCYDPMTGLWTIYDSSSGTNQIRQSDVVPGFKNTLSYVFVGDNADGYYHVNQGGGVSAAFFQTQAIDLGARENKVLKSVALIGESKTTRNVSLQWSDDDYQTWATARTMTFSTTGVAPITYRCGMFRKRSFALSWANNSGSDLLRLEALELDYEVCAT